MGIFFFSADPQPTALTLLDFTNARVALGFATVCPGTPSATPGEPGAGVAATKAGAHLIRVGRGTAFGTRRFHCMNSLPLCSQVRSFLPPPLFVCMQLRWKVLHRQVRDSGKRKRAKIYFEVCPPRCLP